MNTPHGVAIVGLGMALEPHAKSLADLADELHVVAAYSRSQERCRAAIERFGFPATTALDALVGDPKVDIALILTPPATHLEIAERFLRAGKHVLVEKPLEVSLERAERLVQIAAEQQRHLGVVLQHRFRDSSRALAGMLRKGELGRICAASCNVPWWRPQSYYDEPGRGTLARDGGGVLMTQAIHTLDLFRSLVGGVEKVAAVSATTALHRMETEDFVAAAMTLNNGAPASLCATTASHPGFADEILLLCERGTARLKGGTLTVHWQDGRVDEVADAKELGAGGNPMDFPHDAHRELLRDFTDAVAQNRDPVVSGREALQTQDLIATLLESSARSCWLNVRQR